MKNLLKKLIFIAQFHVLDPNIVYGSSWGYSAGRGPVGGLEPTSAAGIADAGTSAALSAGAVAASTKIIFDSS